MSELQDILKSKRETFHIQQGKKSRDRLLQTKRKQFMYNGHSYYMEPKFRQIHEEITHAESNRESVIAALLDDEQLMNDVVACCSMGYDRETPLLIIHNLCWTDSLPSIKKLVQVYRVDKLLCTNLLEKDATPHRLDICLGGISNLLALNSPGVRAPIESFIELRVLQYLIALGSKLVEEMDFGGLYAQILRTIVNAFVAIRYFELEKQVTSQEVFDLFKLSLHAFQLKEEAPLSNMIRIIIVSSDFLNNLIEYFTPEWVAMFMKAFHRWIMLNDHNKVTLCLKMVLAVFNKCTPIYIFQFFQDDEFECRLFESAEINREIFLQILLLLIRQQSEELNDLFRLRAPDILTQFMLAIRPTELYLAASLLQLLLQEYLEHVVSESRPCMEIMSLLEDKYTLSMMHTKTKLQLLQCIYQIVGNVPDSQLTDNLKYALDQDYQQSIDPEMNNAIEAILDICGI